MSGLRQFGKDFAIYGIGDVVIKAFGFFTLPLYTRLFSPADYGILNTIGAASALASSTTSLGMSSAVSRAFFAEEGPRYQSLCVSTGFITLAGWALIVFGIGFISAIPITFLLFGEIRNSGLLILSMLAVPCAQLFAYCQDVTRLQFRPWTFMLLGLTSQLSQLGLAFAFVVWLDFGLQGFFLGSIGAGLLGVILGSVALKGLLAFKFSREMAKGFIKFGGPLVLSSLAGPCFLVTDRFFLTRYAGLESAGLFSVAYSIASGMTFLNAAFARTWSPIAWRMLHSHPHYRERYAMVLLYLLASLSWVAVAISGFSQEFVAILTPAAYHSAWLAVAPLTIYMVANISTQITASGISIVGKTHYFIHIQWAAVCVNAALDFVLVQMWGMLGVAIATMVTEIFVTIAMAITSQRMHPLPYQLSKTFLLAAITTIFISTSYFLPLATTALLVAAKIGFILVFGVLLVIFRIVDISVIKLMLIGIWPGFSFKWGARGN